MSDLTQRIRAKYPGAYDDMSDADLEKAVLAKHPEYADLASKPTPAAPPEKKGLLASIGEMVANDPAISGITRIIGLAKNHPVQTGAVLGGLAAAPLSGGASIPAAMAAAGLGGAGGAGLGSIASALMGNENGPKTSGDVLKAMATEGGASALGEGLGQGVTRMVKPAAKLVYKTALRPSLPLQRDFGDIAATGLSEGLPVSEAGAKAAAARRAASSQAAQQMVTQGAPTAAPIRVMSELGPSVMPIVDRASTRAATGLPNEGPAIAQRLALMQKANPGGIGLQSAQNMKDELQDLASSVYRAQDRGAAVTDLGADTNAGLASGLRQAIEQRVPGVAGQNQRTQSLIGLTRALEDATRRNVPGVGSVRTLLGDFVPSVASGTAINADRAANTAPTILRALVAALGGGQ